MKKSLIYLYLFMIFLGLSNSINFVNASITDSCNLRVSLVNQEPYPAVPGEYVRLVFQVSGVQEPSCQGARFMIEESFPFSLDRDHGWKVLESSTRHITGFNTDWLVTYKVRVDRDALDGNHELIYRFAQGNWDDNRHVSERINIEIEDSRTSFDAVIQGISGNDVSIAITNAGKYTANSMIVRVPNQENFNALGNEGYMVGNLASGDYSLVVFNLAPKEHIITSNEDSVQSTQNVITEIPNGIVIENFNKDVENEEVVESVPSGSQRGRNAPSTAVTNSSIPQSLSNLRLEVHYTDNMGERRISYLTIPLRMENVIQSDNIIRDRIPNDSNVNEIDYKLIGIGALLVIMIFMHFNNKRKFRYNYGSEEPLWIKKAIQSKKKKGDN